MSKKLLTTALTPELYCSDIQSSLHFYTEILRFNIPYEEGFAMLERQGARLKIKGGQTRLI